MVPAHSRPLSSSRRIWLKFVSLVFLLAVITNALRGAPVQAQGAVALLYFRATGVTDHVLIEWETATELAVAGFCVQRSLQAGTGFVQIADCQPAKGDGITGASYSLIDTDVVRGTIYYYRLEVVGSGGVSAIIATVSARAGYRTYLPLVLKPVPLRPIVPVPPADGSRPLADLTAVERNGRFSGPAPTYIKPAAFYVATITTDKGNIVAELYQDTPQSANNFVTLALNGFYDSLTFHRVEPGFVIQGGDPAGNGSGGPGYTIPAEIKHGHPRGALAWARTGDAVNPERRSNGSQFYITLDNTPFLNGGYTVFGYVIEGMSVADRIAREDKIIRVDIREDPVSHLPPPTPTPEPRAPVPQEGRPLAKIPVALREDIYNTPPAMYLDTAKAYQATLETDKGNIVVELDPMTAPITVNNFVLLSNLGFYDGMPVAHVQPAAYMVTGSPAKRPDSDVGYALPLESSGSINPVIVGTVSMYPVQDPATGNSLASGSQFFISFAQMPEGTTPLNIFGKVIEGMEVATKLAVDDIIRMITITERIEPSAATPPVGLYHSKGESAASGTVAGCSGNAPAAQVNGVAAKAVGVSEDWEFPFRRMGR